MENQIKTVYKYDENNIYQGETFIQKDPLNKDSYLEVANTTEIKPIEFDDKKEFLKFNKDENKWKKYNLLNKEIYYYNKKDGYLSNLSPFTIDTSSYTNITPPYHSQEDKIYFNNNSKEWEFSEISFKTKEILLQNAKNDKIKEIEETYNKVQYVKIVNGITFYMPIRGDLFNVILPQVIKIGQGRKDNLSYLRVVNSINNIEYVGKLPYDLLDDIYQKTYDISINNNNNKHAFIKEINAKQELENVKNYNFNYIPIQTININKLIDNYLKNSYNEIGKGYLRKINYKVFTEITIQEPVTLN